MPAAPQQNFRELVESNGRQTATFRFPAAWTAYKYDDEDDPHNRFYRDKVKRAGAVSAVDFVAFDVQADALVMVECKDIRGATADNMPRLQEHVDTPKDQALAEAIGAFKSFIKKRDLPLKVVRDKPYLPMEFAKNIRDTLVGLLAAHRAQNQALQAFSFEMDALPDWKPYEGARLLARLKAAIEREVSFLQNVEVIICSGLNRVQPHQYTWQIRVSP